MNVERTKLKFLEKQVKLEKMRLKHAKVVAKMEKNRNSFLQQELARLKLDFGQMLFRLDVLDRYFSSSDGGTEKMVKVNLAFESLTTYSFELLIWNTRHLFL
jgi:hypothetical protein